MLACLSPCISRQLPHHGLANTTTRTSSFYGEYSKIPNYDNFAHITQFIDHKPNKNDAVVFQKPLCMQRFKDKIPHQFSCSQLL